MQEFMTMVVPIFLISWVAMLAIIVPESSGEKIGFCVAIDLGLIFLKGLGSLNDWTHKPERTYDVTVRVRAQQS